MSKVVEIGMQIHYARKSMGLKQNDLAKLLSLSQGYIGQIERGVHFPSGATLQKLSDLLQTEFTVYPKSEK